ncbi:MAG: TIGR02757 family protein [Thermodesulfovibrionales bacterium]|nr:TIGR02757 family protein [Thermodesulfovibrionales bacterium]
MMIKNLLDKLYEEFDFTSRIAFDPIQFPKRYSKHEDIESSAFISSCFAYGQVGVFMSVIDKMLSICGKSPYDFLVHFDVKKHKRLLDNLKYRFNDSDDIVCLFYCMSELLKRYGSLKSFFLLAFTTSNENILFALDYFVKGFLSIDTTIIYGRDIKTFGFKQLLPSPIGNSPCKRLNLFLRWMVRDKDIDFGIWKEIPKASLIIPLDTHIARISRCLGLTKRHTVDIKTAIEITENLKGFDPDDPLKYDFALCHLGISRACNKKHCFNCNIKEMIHNSLSKI